MTNANSPTQAGFIVWIRAIMGVPTGVLPDNAPIIGYAYDTALAVTNSFLACIPGPIYKYAVYNLGGSLIIQFAQDTPPSTFWADLRKSFGVNNFVAGVVSASGDQGTNASYEVIQGAKNFTLEDLQRLKDPYGRQYLAWAMQWGTLWGLTP